jgi:hypothetical protein
MKLQVNRQNGLIRFFCRIIIEIDLCLSFESVNKPKQRDEEARMPNRKKFGIEGSEILSLLFGVLLILVTFGDAHIDLTVGNLDTIFGLGFWRALDVFYPLASIVVFLLYGRVKGNGLKTNAKTVFLFASFIIVLLLVNLDDLMPSLNVTLEPSNIYWIIISWVYPVYSSIAFFLFGKEHETVEALEKND